MGHVAVFTIRHTWASVGNVVNEELSTWFRADACLATIQFLTASPYRLNRQTAGLHLPLWWRLGFESSQDNYATLELDRIVSGHQTSVSCGLTKMRGIYWSCETTRTPHPLVKAVTHVPTANPQHHQPHPTHLQPIANMYRAMQSDGKLDGSKSQSHGILALNPFAKMGKSLSAKLMKSLGAIPASWKSTTQVWPCSSIGKFSRKRSTSQDRHWQR